MRRSRQFATVPSWHLLRTRMGRETFRGHNGIEYGGFLHEGFQAAKGLGTQRGSPARTQNGNLTFREMRASRLANSFPARNGRRDDPIRAIVAIATICRHDFPTCWSDHGQTSGSAERPSIASRRRSQTNRRTLQSASSKVPQVHRLKATTICWGYWHAVSWPVPFHRLSNARSWNVDAVEDDDHA